MSTSSPPHPAAHDDGGSPSDPPAPAAVPVSSSSSTTSQPSSTPTDPATSDPSSAPSRDPPRLESGAEDCHTSVIDPALLSKHAGRKTKQDEEDKLDRFSCHICLEVPDEPVVSPCGHLYCWPCMHEWLVVAHGRACPVCKAVLTVNQLVPIYTSAEAVDPRSRPIPPRPRPAAPPPPAPSFRAPAFRNPFAVLDAAHMGGIGGGGGADPAELMTAPLGPGGGGGSAFSFQAGVFPLPGLSFRWSWPPTATPRLVDETGQRIMMRDPHAVNRPPTRDEWLRAVVQQVFLAVFFAMFVAITFGG